MLGHALASVLPQNALPLGLPETEARVLWDVLLGAFGPPARAKMDRDAREPRRDALADARAARAAAAQGAARQRRPDAVRARRRAREPERSPRRHVPHRRLRARGAHRRRRASRARSGASSSSPAASRGSALRSRRSPTSSASRCGPSTPTRAGTCRLRSRRASRSRVRAGCRRCDHDAIRAPHPRRYPRHRGGRRLHDDASRAGCMHPRAALGRASAHPRLAPDHRACVGRALDVGGADALADDIPRPRRARRPDASSSSTPRSSTTTRSPARGSSTLRAIVSSRYRTTTRTRSAARARDDRDHRSPRTPIAVTRSRSSSRSGSSSETDPKNAHTPAEPGGDIATWFYNPNGDLGGCPALDAGIDAPIGRGRRAREAPSEPPRARGARRALARGRVLADRRRSRSRRRR